MKDDDDRTFAIKVHKQPRKKAFTGYRRKEEDQHESSRLFEERWKG